MARTYTDFPPVRACLFDMDGLLIDSEDIYTLCTNKILREFGKPDLPWSIKAQLQGRPGPEASAIFQKWAQLPIPHSEYIQKQAACQRQHFPTTKPLPGVSALLHDLTTRTSVHVALATSSHSANYKLKTTHLQQDIFSCFPNDRIVLGDDPRIPHGRGKPAPDIYLLALETINEGLRRAGEEEIKPEECLVFEDSVPGVEAGRRAGMRVVWVPNAGLLKEYRGREREVLAGLAGEFKGDGQGVVDGQQSDNKEGEQQQDRVVDAPVARAPGALDDGWAELLHSLEDFPYHHYGININIDRK